MDSNFSSEEGTMNKSKGLIQPRMVKIRDG